ncbi:unnamed protein product [Rotaria magnacalcarata]|uniref:Uncharacterized protein n=1 Tax=Rotaria magnacalcarata TaxID=392030 RepID=A0A816SRR7_9BILA|nr:unnamed protein product [Rotaria magnacalcarata]CAF1568938.1 unnamed protein product [Rotaria magnacalcarata]CAF2091982.1 unnamed protein product [Rotaria magnacalcarata]CAF4020520.1 unnamed protein product [Rotaria magnacalcarata]CAF4022103.1 unnamed protein product [Rotaria magnacalcarata]
MRWDKSALNELCYPQGLLVDMAGTLYIADRGNNSVVRWFTRAKKSTLIIDISDRKEVLNHVNKPMDISLDSHGYLYLLDNWNERIIRSSFEYFQSNNWRSLCCTMDHLQYNKN